MEKQMSIMDYEQELSTAGGQLFNAADGNPEYGARALDMKVAGFGNPAIGEPLSALFEVVDANSDVGTSLDLEIVADDDGAGTNAVSLGKKSAVLVANLTRYARHVVQLDPTAAIAATNQYLAAKVTTHGTPATTGKIRVSLLKGTYAVPVNPGV
jgi:hypothetical protein